MSTIITDYYTYSLKYFDKYTMLIYLLKYLGYKIKILFGSDAPNLLSNNFVHFPKPQICFALYLLKY